MGASPQCYSEAVESPVDTRRETPKEGVALTFINLKNSTFTEYKIRKILNPYNLDSLYLGKFYFIIFFFFND